MIQLKINDTVTAIILGEAVTGEVLEIANNGCFIDVDGYNFAHRDNITHINNKEIEL